MKKVWLGIGAIVITILLLLQTRFTEFLRLDNSGYAVETGAVKQLLFADPNAEEFVGEDVPFHAFETMEYIYQRGNSYYLGQKKKAEIDMDFPMLINDGAGIMFLDNASSLFDVEFQNFETYRGLMMSDKVAYNPGGERADANEYLFVQLSNGLYMNLTPMTFEDKGELREVTMNSFVCFRENYFTYMEPINGIGVYQRCNHINDNDIVTIDDEDYTYHELLLLLNAITEMDGKQKSSSPLPIPEETPVPEVAETDEETVMEEPVNKEQEKEETPEEKEEEKPDTPSSASADTSSGSQAGSSSSSGGGSDSSASSSEGGKGAKQEGSMGVRPDTARPDKKQDSKDTEPLVPNYEKPTVIVEDMRAGVYRIMLDVQVTDPAFRLNTLRRVQFEFYEVAADDSEQLVYRTYTGTSNTVEAGNGAIKAGTKYRVNAYFTYYDENNQSVVESILLPDDGYITTKERDTLGKVVFKTGTEAGVDYLQIPFYYDNKVVITNVAYDSQLSDPEAVYAIDNSVGLNMHITGVSNPLFVADCKMDRNALVKFKKGNIVDLSSLPTLKPSNSYQYELEAQDYFGYDIELENHTGTFETCKSRPIGSIKLDTNEISNLSMKVSMVDPDKSAIPVEGGTDYEYYLVIATERYNTVGGFSWAACQEYVDNGNQRIAADEANGIEEGTVHYVYQFTQGELLDINGEIDLSKLLTATDLDLNTKYHAYLIGDFDLNNKRGPQRKEEIAYLAFTSATLSSLGNIYVKVDISNVGAHSAVISYTLNDARTNPVLTELLSDISFGLVPVGGENAHASITFDEMAMKTFTGWYVDGAGDRVRGAIGSVLMDGNFFDEEQGGTPLNSMTEYELVPDIKATYNGKKYDMNVALTSSHFKTMREPAKVRIINDVFAAGTLLFDVKIEDPDEAITGNSGHVVVMNIYDYNRNFVKAVRIPKNTEDYINQRITGLDSSKQYFLTFVAVEYNEGYTNATYENNKVIYTHMFDSYVDIKGTLKLQNIVAGLQNKLVANTKATISDAKRILNKEIPYFISVEKNGVDITDSYNSSLTNIIDYEYGTGNVISKEHPFTVDKGRNTYTMTLYIWYNQNKLVLDTLTFTTEDVIVGISNAQSFVEIMKNSQGKGRYIITEDIDLGTTSTNYKVDGKDVKPTALVSNFEGQIDFQGYELTLNMVGNVEGIFTNLGPKAELCNGVFNFKADTGTRIYNHGLLCDYNYGHIHDVIVNYQGGSGVTNQYYGLICRSNMASGIIERFVVHNNAEEGLFPFTADYQAGLVTSGNSGIIRDGYVYGEDIYAAPGKSRGGALLIGGIVGSNGHTAQLQNVFSLVNVIVAPPQDADGKANTQYGSVVGLANGKIMNAYGIGQSTYTVPDTSNGEYYDVDGIGPALGTNNSTHRNIYYWNEQEKTYPKGTYQTLISLESLHDYDWQKSLLSSSFDVQPVEVGFYPQIIMNQELPQQEFIPLPERSYANLVEIMSATVLSYAEDGNSAEVEFRLSNTRNVFVQEIEIDGLTVTLDYNSAVSLDGYTTIRGIVSNPTKYVSAYEITGAKCQYNNRTQSVTFTPAPLLMVDFYRNIHNADEWYRFVVQAPNENARLANDIDFTGVQPKYIRVTSQYNGKLSGGRKEGCTYGYSLKNINFSAEQLAYVFADVRGEISGICVENLILGTNKTKENDTTGFVRNLYGSVQNVHMNTVTIEGTTYIGSLVSYAREGAVIRNCTASDVSILYKELPNTNTTARVGGLVGTMESARLENCFVRNLMIDAMDLSASNGIGGLVGYANTSCIDSAYVTGKITARGMNVGGMVGTFVCNRHAMSLRNILVRVNVTCSQDSVGGIVGELRLNEALMTDRINATGAALGNVFCSNTDSENVSYTVGYMSGNRVSFYGTDFQLMNGLIGATKDENTYGLLTYEQMTTPATYTDSSLLNMDVDIYDYSKAAEGYIPTLYYEDKSALLPFQEEDLPISQVKVANNLIKVTDIGVTQSSNRIWMDIEGPAGYIITGITIEDLLYSMDGEAIINDRGYQRVVLTYRNETQQEHFKDSYDLVGISYKKADASEVGMSDYSSNPIRVPLVLFKDIYDIPTWNAAFSDANNSGNYENYRIVEDIDFSTGEVYATNTKVGRLIGKVTENQGQRANLTNIKLKKNNENLIFRLNSELSNVNITNCSIETAGRNNVGLVGTSAGRIYDATFDNISIENKSTARSYVGIIAYQQGGCIGEQHEGMPEKGKVIAKNISIGQQYGLCTHAGGIVGYAAKETFFTNIEAENIKVRGTAYLGGILGSSGKVSMDGITAKDFIIIGTTGAGRVGGIIGLADTGYTKLNSATMGNITLTGTPTYDEAGNIISSTTTIGVDKAKVTVSAQYIGGVFGIVEAKETGYSGSSISNKEPIHVDGIVVQGYSDCIGGVSGRAREIANASIENSLITTVKPIDSARNYIGGISGYNYYTNQYNTVKGCQISATNFAQAGIIVGTQTTSDRIAYVQAENSSLVINRTIASEGLYYGGIAGSCGTISYSTVYNCTVDASDGSMAVVGGIAGIATTVNGCFFYGEPDSADGPKAEAKYAVKGKRLVGGILGQNRYSSGSITKCYSNANVIATQHAGGLVGAYENYYSSAIINGSARYTYAGCSMQHNYFAGTVAAERNAGGFIGRLGMVNDVNVAATHKLRGGRNASAGIEGGKSGSKNEENLTSYNMLFAESITATDGTAYAYAGNFDGFEGKANRGTGVSVDLTAVDKAGFTYLYAGTVINGTPLYDMQNTTAPEHARNSGIYRYKLFGDYESKGIQDYNLANNANVRLVLPSDLQSVNPKTGSQYRGGYNGMKQYTGWHIARGSRKDKDMRGDYFRMITEDVIYDGGCANMGVEDTEFYRGKNYLPHIRINTGAGGISDFLTKYQSAMRIAMPIPTGSFAPRLESMMSFSLLGARPIVQSYGTVYASDIDKINLEFSEDLLSGGYFILYYGNEIVDKRLIDKRAYSYSYDFKKDLKLCYGFADEEIFKELMVAEGRVYGQDFTEEDILNEHSRQDEYLYELKATAYKSRSLEHHIMTYGDKYYYIDEQGLWSGTGSSASVERTKEQEKSREDSSAQLLPGDYVTIYNGKALTSSGNVIKVANGEILRNVSGITPIEDRAIPLQVFVPKGEAAVTVETYSRFCEIISTEGIVVREAQYLQSALGVENIIDAQIANVKDSVVQYEKDDFVHCTVLGKDGIMFDMYSGDELNAPEDFKSSGIVYMTNNLKCTAPFLLVEYQNGGIVGYNYMTGEYLFDHSVTDVMSLLDYAKVYFSGVKSELSEIPLTYAANAELVKIAGTPKRLTSMVTGNSTGADEKHNTGENTAQVNDPDSTDKAEDGKPAANVFQDVNYDDYTAPRDQENVEVIEKDAGGDGDDNEGDINASGMLSTSGDEEVNTLGMEGNTTGSEEIPIIVEGDSQIEGNSKGNGVNLEQGIAKVNGSVETEAEGTITLTEGTTALTEGTTALTEGAEATEGTAEATEGTAEATEGTAEATEGTAEATEGTAEAAEGTAEATEGTAEAAEGTAEATEGTAEATEGTAEATEGTEAVEVAEATDSSKQQQMEITTLVSTAGTPVKVAGTTSGVNNGDTPKITTSDNETEAKTNSGGVNESELITVYNQSTGTYEIVDKTQYFSNQNYYSENQRLNVKNLSSVYTGFAEKEPEKQEANGLGLYIFVTLCALGGIGGTIWYRKKHKMKF